LEICPLKQGYNAFFKGKKAVIERSWQELNDIIFQATCGISPIDAIRENFFSSSQRIGIGIYNGFIKPGSVMV
jgi:hypothetical protein